MEWVNANCDKTGNQLNVLMVIAIAREMFRRQLVGDRHNQTANSRKNMYCFNPPCSSHFTFIS